MMSMIVNADVLPGGRQARITISNIEYKMPSVGFHGITFCRLHLIARSADNLSKQSGCMSSPIYRFKNLKMSRLMRKPTICICKIKGAFVFADSAIPLLLISKISSI